MPVEIYTADEWNKKTKLDFDKVQAERKTKAQAAKEKREEADKAKGNYLKPSGSKDKAAI